MAAFWLHLKSKMLKKNYEETKKRMCHGLMTHPLFKNLISRSLQQGLHEPLPRFPQPILDCPSIKPWLHRDPDLI